MVFNIYKCTIFKIFLSMILLEIILCEPPVRIIMGTKNQKIKINSDCEQFEVLTNYKHININVSNLKNIEKVMITDKLITNCNMKECANDSNICQSKYNSITCM
jgi:hypothetical protein